MTTTVTRRDVALALATAAAQLGVAVLASGRPHHPAALSVGSVALLTAGPVALLVARGHPRAALLGTFAVAVVYAAADWRPRGPVFLALIVAFWGAMTTGHRRLGWSSLLAGYALFVVLLPLSGAEPTPSVAWASGIAAWMLLLGATAEVVRIDRERALQVAAARHEQSRRAAGEERLRIARELHDVLAHDLSLINVQAGVALHLIEERPQQTRAALEAIKGASKDALGELRSVLDVLRAPAEPAPRTPTDGLDGLDRLLGRVRAAGLAVRAQIDGVQKPLPPGVDLAAYRIIQEALTNVTRHAPHSAATVRLTCDTGELVIQVDNDEDPDANGAGGPAEGNGIRGMRERASALGGALDAGPRPGGGFQVRARLPLQQA